MWNKAEKPQVNRTEKYRLKKIEKALKFVKIHWGA